MGFTVWFNIGLGNMKCGNICIEYITENISVININDKMLYSTVLLIIPNIQTEPYLVFFKHFPYSFFWEIYISTQIILLRIGLMYIINREHGFSKTSVVNNYFLSRSLSSN